MSFGSRRRVLPPALVLLLTVAVLALPTSETPEPPHAALEPTTPHVLLPASAPGSAAARELRAGSCENALASARLDSEGASLAGLYAHACANHSAVLEEILKRPTADDGLDDWRLWTLAKSAVVLGQPALAQRSYATLTRDYSTSPLAGPALAAAAELALERNDTATAGRLLARRPALALDRERAAQVESAFWRAATAVGDRAAAANSARRLLVEHPVAAARLAVVDSLRQADGTLDWAKHFDTQSLVRRARRLVEVGLAESAVQALDQIALGERDLDWALLRAEALTRSARGAEALSALATLADPGSAAERTRIEWRKAGAALEASVARRGRRIGADRRASYRREGHRHLRRVVEVGGDETLSKKSLRILFADLADDGRFEEALETLRALRRLDPTDLTGADYLWRRGWRELESQNSSSAIGFWAELRRLYPQSTAARRALYWSARAHHDLGNEDRSQSLLHEVVAVPVADFYHRHAMEWLVEAPATEREPLTPTDWPRDPLLDRAWRLTDLGFDAAARLELELVGERADPRAAQALLAVILARQGETRQSIIELRRAFPELGTHRQARAPLAARQLYYPLAFDGVVREAAQRQRLPPHLVFAMIRQESAFDSGAHSRVGARGLMQVMPATGRELAGRLGLHYRTSRLVEPDFSVQLGTAYYQQILRSFGDEELALAGYNAGPTRIRRWWNRSGDWGEVDRFIEGLPFDETRTYVQRIVLLSNSYRELYAS